MSSTSAKKMTTAAIIGAGNVAWHIAHRLVERAVTVGQVWSRNIAHAEELATSLGEGAQPIAGLDKLDGEADICFIAVPDHAIAEVASSLPLHLRGIVAHTSASVPLEAIPERYRRAKLYPFQTFTRGVDVDWSQVAVMVNADNGQTLEEALEWARALSPRVTEADDGLLGRVHLAAAWACNGVCHLLWQACQTLGGNPAEAMTLLRPLIDATIEKVTAMGPLKAQTGPARRGDLDTLARHIKLLRQQKPQSVSLYKTLTQSILDTYEQNTLRSDQNTGDSL